MSTGDAVFPIPAPTFLWVHNLVVEQTGASAALVIDAEGAWSHDDALPTVDFTGYLTAPDPREVDRAAKSGYLLAAVALAPRGTVVAEQDRLLASGVDDYLDGRYTIREIRPNLSHLRLLCERLKGDGGGP